MKKVLNVRSSAVENFGLLTTNEVSTALDQTLVSRKNYVENP